jgi:hypothetical protein
MLRPLTEFIVNAVERLRTGSLSINGIFLIIANLFPFVPSSGSGAKPGLSNLG